MCQCKTLIYRAHCRRASNTLNALVRVFNKMQKLAVLYVCRIPEVIRKRVPSRRSSNSEGLTTKRAKTITRREQTVDDTIAFSRCCNMSVVDFVAPASTELQ